MDRIVTNSNGDQYRWDGDTWQPVSLTGTITGGTPGAGDAPVDPTNGPVTPVGTPGLQDAIKRLIYQDESGFRNVPNYRYDPTHTAGGYGQITNTTWRGIAPAAGIDTSQYPTAMSAPFEVQDKAVDALLDKQGVAPWAPYNPKLRKDLAAIGVNTMLPPFGNARAMSALMPGGGDPNAVADPTGGFVPGAGSGTASTTLDPVLVSALAASGNAPTPGAGSFDPTQAYQKLLSTGYGFNPSKLLASMAAGFLGGKGPAASLAGGFSAMANSQQQDTQNLGELAKYSMLYGPILQAKLDQQKLSAFTGGLRSGKVLPSTIGPVLGLTPQKLGAQSWDELDEKVPLPAGAQKQVTASVDNIGKLSRLEQQFGVMRDQLANGEFHLDWPHRTAYLGIINHVPGAETAATALYGPQVVDEAPKWNAFNQTTAQARELVANAQKGALSDARSKGAMEAIAGGYGQVDDKTMLKHLNLLENNAHLDINDERNKIQSAYSTSGRKLPNNFWGQYNLPETPLNAVPIDEAYKNLYGNNTPEAAAPAAPVSQGGQVGLPQDIQGLVQKYKTPQQ